MKKFILTLSNGKAEYPLNLTENVSVNLIDYEGMAIRPQQTKQLKNLLTNCPEYDFLFDILNRGLEVHIWRKKE